VQVFIKEVEAQIRRLKITFQEYAADLMFLIHEPDEIRT